MNTGKMETHIKFYLAVGAFIGMIYTAWNFFEQYNTNTMETAEIVKDSVATDKEIVIAILDTRAEAAKETADQSARARLYYQEKVEEGSATPADKRRLKYFEEAIPKQEAKANALSEKLEEVESLK